MRRETLFLRVRFATKNSDKDNLAEDSPLIIEELSDKEILAIVENDFSEDNQQEDRLEDFQVIFT